MIKPQVVIKSFLILTIDFTQGECTVLFIQPNFFIAAIAVPLDVDPGGDLGRINQATIKVHGMQQLATWRNDRFGQTNGLIKQTLQIDALFEDFMPDHKGTSTTSTNFSLFSPNIRVKLLTPMASFTKRTKVM